MPRPDSRKFVGRYAGVGELLRSPEMVADMLRRAENAKRLAEAIAPAKTGQFKRSFRASADSHGGVHHDRACGTLTNVDPSAFPIEVGTRDTPRHDTLKRAMLEGMGDH